MKNSSSEYDKEKIIGQFDVLYRTLIRLGFHIEDISASFEATLSKSIDDNLDWVIIEKKSKGRTEVFTLIIFFLQLCVHVPYERMPVGFFDRYFNDNDEGHLVLLHNSNNNKEDKPAKKVPEPIIEEEKLVLKKNSTKSKESVDEEDDIKSRILQAAQQYMVIMQHYTS